MEFLVVICSTLLVSGLSWKRVRHEHLAKYFLEDLAAEASLTKSSSRYYPLPHTIQLVALSGSLASYLLLSPPIAQVIPASACAARIMECRPTVLIRSITAAQSSSSNRATSVCRF